CADTFLLPIPTRTATFPLVAPARIGTVVAWGSNVQGQTNVPTDLSTVVAIAGGGNHTVALLKAGGVRGGGYNNWGQATPPDGLGGVVAIATGDMHTVALRDDGTVVAWGIDRDKETTIDR